MEEGPAKKITKRTRLTLAEQAEVARLLRSGKNAAHVMAQFSISRRTVTNIKKRADAIIYHATEVGLPLSTKTVRVSQFPQIETEVFQFVTAARALKIPLTQAALAERALLVREHLLQAELPSPEKNRIQTFVASKGWVDNFVLRHSLRSISLVEAHGNAIAESVTRRMAVLWQKLRAYDIECVFNVNETALFFKLLPRHSYFYEYKSKKSVRGRNSMSAKDMITAYVCSNAYGHKLPMAIIGKPKNPRCFRIAKSPVPYINQKNSCSDAVTYRQWFYNVFVPFVRRFTSKPVALLMNSCGPHGADLIDPKSQIAVFTLPPNCTAIRQPMDMGIIATWKAQYRKMMLRAFVEDVESRQLRRDNNDLLRNGMKGMGEGNDPHLLDVASWVRAGWDEVTTQEIAICWVKSKVLPAIMEEELNAMYGHMQSTSTTVDVKIMKEWLAKCYITLDRRDPFYDQLLKNLSEQDLNKWLSIEEDDDVRCAMAEDALSSPEVEHTDDGHQDEKAGDGSEDEQCKNPVPLPPMDQVLNRFRDLEDMAYNCKVSDCILYLRRARRVFIDAKKKEGSASMQLLITEMLKDSQ